MKTSAFVFSIIKTKMKTRRMQHKTVRVVPIVALPVKTVKQKVRKPEKVIKPSKPRASIPAY